jgi:hypothetical protein
MRSSCLRELMIGVHGGIQGTLRQNTAFGFDHLALSRLNFDIALLTREVGAVALDQGKQFDLSRSLNEDVHVDLKAKSCSETSQWGCFVGVDRQHRHPCLG